MSGSFNHLGLLVSNVTSSEGLSLATCPKGLAWSPSVTELVFYFPHSHSCLGGPYCLVLSVFAVCLLLLLLPLPPPPPAAQSTERALWVPERALWVPERGLAGGWVGVSPKGQGQSLCEEEACSPLVYIFAKHS